MDSPPAPIHKPAPGWRRGSELSAAPPTLNEQVQVWFQRNKRRACARAMTEIVWMGCDTDDEGRPVGLMDLAPHCAADGRGVTAIFEEALPRVAHVQVFVDGRIDMVYKRSAAGVWRGQQVRERQQPSQ